MTRTTATKPVNPIRFTSTPRDVRLTANGKAVMGIAIAIAAAAIAAAIGLTILRAGQQDTRDRLIRDGVAAEADVTRVTRTRGDDPRTDVVYRYVAADGAHDGSAGFSQRASRNIVEGGHIAIVYLRSEPARSWVAGREPGVLPLLVVPSIALGLLLLAAAIAWHVRRSQLLLAEGRFAQARVMATTKVKRQHHHAYRVRYEFTTMSGATVTGSVERARATASAGDTIPIVYHRENPHWNTLYPLSLVTPERR